MYQNVTIVLYHHISGETNPLTSQIDISISPELFTKHVKYFVQNYDLIGINDLLSGKLPRKPLLITFDDAYRSVLDVGGAILRAVNAPWIFFINPATVVSHTVPFDNVLSYAISELGIGRVLPLLKVPARDISRAGELIAKIGPKLTLSDISAVKRAIFAALGTTETETYSASGLFLDLADVTALAECRIDIGNHSMNHVFFRALTTMELDREIAESRALIEHISGRSVNCLSVPYGSEIDATKAALSVARATGHQAIFLVHARSNRFRPAEDIYYRVSPGNVPPGILPRQLCVDPVLRTIRDAICGRRIRSVLH